MPTVFEAGTRHAAGRSADRVVGAAVKREPFMPRSYERFRGVLVLCGVAFAALGAYPALAQQAGPAPATDDGRRSRPRERAGAVGHLETELWDGGFQE